MRSTLIVAPRSSCLSFCLGFQARFSVAYIYLSTHINQADAINLSQHPLPLLAAPRHTFVSGSEPIVCAPFGRQTNLNPSKEPMSQTETQVPAKQGSMLHGLCQLAHRNIAECRHEVGYYQPMNDSMLGPDIYKLAVETSLRPLILRKELLHVFFEPDAAELLLRLPNRYWFWTVVLGAIVKAEEVCRNKPVPQAFVAEKLAEIRRIYAGKYNLQLALPDLSQSQVASRALAGVILVRACCGELDEIVINPIFAPCPGTEGTLSQSAAALTAALLKV